MESQPISRHRAGSEATHRPDLARFEGRATLLRPGWKAIVVAAAAIALGWALKDLVWALARPLALITLSLVLALALAPLVDWLNRRLPRVVSILGIYAVLLALAAGLAWLIVAPLIEQLDQVVTQWPEYIEGLQQWLNSIGIRTNLTQNLTEQIQQFSQQLLSVPMTLIGWIFDLILVVVLSVWWLISLPSLHRFVLSLFPESSRDEAASIMHDMGQSMGGFVRGTTIDMAIVGVLLYVGFKFIGLDFALVLAVFGGMMEAIPMAGPIIASIPAIGVGLLQSPLTALIVLIFYLVIGQIEGNLLMPKIMGAQAHIPPVVVLIALMFGAALGGLLGALVAIPLAGAVRVLVLRLVAPWVRRWNGAAPA